MTVVPSSPDEIDARYLGGCLQVASGPRPTVTDVQIEPLRKGTSGDQLFSVRALADGRAVRLILKLNRPEEVAETLFYRHLAPHVAVDTPRVADARLLADGRGWSLIEELDAKDDLTWTEAEYRDVVTDMAAMHATYWNSPVLETYPWLWRPTPDAVGEIIGGLLELARLMQSMELPAPLVDIYSPTRLERIAAVLLSSDELVTPLLAAGVTLVHGDYWFHNILITGDSRRALIDWQGCRVFSGIWRSATSSIYCVPLAPPSTGSCRFPKSASPAGTCKRYGPVGCRCPRSNSPISTDARRCCSRWSIGSG